LNKYACGGWVRRFDIPAGQSSVSAFSVLAEENEAVVRTGLEAVVKDPSVDPAVVKAASYYTACNDMDSRNSASAAAFRKEIIQKAVQDPPTLVGRLALLQQAGLSPLFAAYVSTDDRNSSLNTLKLTQAGLGLPDRDYYINKPMADRTLDAYAKYIEAGLSWTGETVNLTTRARNVVLFEQRLAVAFVPQVKPQAV
jgi:predicted metalloendopeptidase